MIPLAARVRRRSAAVLASAVLALTACSGTSAAREPTASSSAAPSRAALEASEFGVAPWSEVIVSVRDPDASAAWLIEDGGWQETERGAIARSELSYWGLPDEASGRFLKICAPDSDSGCIRYVVIEGAGKQRPIRLAARPWDTGGIFSIMLRSEDVQSMFDAAIARGWWAESPPYAFSFGSSDLVNVVIRGPHGVNYALYERRSPPFTGFALGRLSQAFNTMRMVEDQPASLEWYRKLGLQTLFDAPFTDPEPRANNFSVPANLAAQLVRRAAVVQPVLPGETGRMELMQFEGFDGRDFGNEARLPNLGIISVRYPVRDHAAYRTMIERQGIDIVRSADSVEIAALRGAERGADIFAVRDPDGNLTEFYHAR